MFRLSFFEYEGGAAVMAVANNIGLTILQSGKRMWLLVCHSGLSMDRPLLTIMLSTPRYWVNPRGTVELISLQPGYSGVIITSSGGAINIPPEYVQPILGMGIHLPPLAVQLHSAPLMVPMNFAHPIKSVDNDAFSIIASFFISPPDSDNSVSTSTAKPSCATTAPTAKLAWLGA
ncbi:Uncharacterised protein [Kluyvera ascorbata]|nr:Uncharacterised protein [Kluyvera ascorbata]